MCQKVPNINQESTMSMDFHVDIYFQERWVDRRLRHTGRDKILIRDAKIFDRMWHPDLYFANARTSEFHYVTSPNFFAWVYPNGTVYYDTRISLTVMCMMDLYKYPLDRQVCDIRILSYAYDETQVKIKWLDNSPIVRNDIIKLPDMELASITTGECNGEYAIGKWSCVTAVFVVNRAITHHILQSYIPTALMVIISWFSFWLDVDSVPGRVSLCITTLLTLATQASAARLALPQNLHKFSELQVSQQCNNNRLVLLYN
uniref:Uncharacterized protein n=1 Tax=Romanomermis culicivorax TaxID=13658 RepID=A0A915K5U8_ROMCU